MLGICCLDKCPAAEERTLLSSKLELDFERLSNPCFTELDRIEAKFTRACCSKSGTRSRAFSSSLQSLSRPIEMMSFSVKMPVWHWHLQIGQLGMAVPFSIHFLHVELRISPRYVLIVGHAHAYCCCGNFIRRGFFPTPSLNSVILLSKSLLNTVFCLFNSAASMRIITVPLCPHEGQGKSAA